MRFHSTSLVLPFLGGSLVVPPFSSAFVGLAATPSSRGIRSTPSFWTRLFSSSSSDSMKDQTFNTWGFDGPCLTMEWNSLKDIETSIAQTDSGEAVMEADLILVGVLAPAAKEEEEEKDETEEEEELPAVELVGLAKGLEEALGGNGVLSGLMEENNKAFKNGAKAGATTPAARIMTKDGTSKRVVFVGLGSTPNKKDDDDKEDENPKKKLQGVGAAIGKAVASQCQSQKKVETCAFVLPESFTSEYPSEATSQMLVDFTAAFYQNLYSDNRYKSKDKKVAEDMKSLAIWTEASLDETAAVQEGRQLATGILLAKDIVNAPHNVLNSLSLAETARRLAQDSDGGCISCEILGKDECEKRGMGAFLGVARGSETEPQFIHLTYKPPAGGDSVKKVAVIGKGLLFDTGGYNIKTQMMSLMKFDCGGAAAVLGAARAIGQVQPPGVEVHFIVAACENMINAKAMVPSDILTASNGKTIEVLNTDAEGRLTLADALVFADKEVGAESIIELSTLTGACIVSLGKQIAGVWTSNDDLAEELEQASKATGDKTWRMPLATEYNEELESSISADLKNIGGKYAGAITAALFLTNFVSKKKPFAHIDIAGPVWNDKTGATGYGSQLVVEWVRRQGSSS